MDGVVAVNIDKDFFSEGSENEGDVVGLWDGEIRFGAVRGSGRGGKSTSEDSDGGARTLWFCDDGDYEECGWSGVLSGGESTGATARGKESHGRGRSCNELSDDHLESKRG